MKINNFNDCLKMGVEWEHRIKPKLMKMLVGKALKNINFSDNPEMQRKGIDIILTQKNPTIDLKVRDYKYYNCRDILMETISVVETGTPGWLYTSQADLISYVWQTLRGTNLIDGYMLLIQEIRPWFKKNKWAFYTPRDAISERDGRTWHTRNVAVPIYSFPIGTVFRFNPKLTDNEQTTIFDFSKRKSVIQQIRDYCYSTNNKGIVDESQLLSWIEFKLKRPPEKYLKILKKRDIMIPCVEGKLKFNRRW